MNATRVRQICMKYGTCMVRLPRAEIRQQHPIALNATEHHEMVEAAQRHGHNRRPGIDQILQRHVAIAISAH